MSTAPPRTRELVDELGTKGLEILFVVGAPPDDVLELLWDHRNYGRLYPEVKAVAVIRELADEIDLEFQVDAVIKKVRYVLRRNVDRDKREIVWRELSGDLKRVRGLWKISASADASVSEVTYRAFVDIGRFVPTSLVRDLALRKAAEMVARVRRVATGG